MNARAGAIGRLVFWTALIAAIDQGIKGIVVATLPGKSYPIITGLFSLTYQQNEGVAFSMLRNAHIAVVLALNLLVLAFFLFLIRPYLNVRLGRAAAVLVLGGALGNVIDRIVRHAVIDYLSFYISPRLYWPVFNLADAFVVCGVALLVLMILRGERAKSTLSCSQEANST